MKKYFTAVAIFIIACTTAQAQTRTFTLEEAIDYALQNNLTARQGILDVKLGELDYNQSRLNLLPDLNASASYSNNWGRSIDPTTNLFVDNQRIVAANGNISTSVLLFNGLRLQNIVKQNRRALDATEKGLEAIKNDVALNVATYYLNVLFAQSLVEIAESQLEATSGQLQGIQRQVEVGALPQSNLLDLRAQQATNEVNLVNRRNDLILARIQLKQALQLPPSAEVEIVDPEIEIESAEIIQETALEIYEYAEKNMPQILSAQYSLESAQYGVSAAKGALYPSISLNAGMTTRYSDAYEDEQRFIPDGGDPIILPNPEIGYVDVNGTLQPVYSNEPNIIPSGELVNGYPLGEQINDNLSKWIGISLNIPIFNSLQARNNIQRAAINRERAELNLINEKYILWQTIEQSYADVVAALKSYNASESQVKAAEEAFRMTQKRQNLGAATFIDYQIAENQLFQARAELLRAKYDFIFKSKVLDFYLGNPLGL